jgi:hypothetical protein
VSPVTTEETKRKPSMIENHQMEEKLYQLAF